MELTKQVTSLEISKRLKELGVKQENLFYWVRDDKCKLPYKISYGTPTGSYETKPVKKWLDGEMCSAFTVAELGEMLPAGALGAYLNIFKNVDKGWNVGYGLEVTLEADTEADARGKMLIYLLENSLLTNPT